MTYKVGPKGQVVLPKALRDELGIRPGDEVEVERRGDALLVQRVAPRSRVYGALAGTDVDLLADLRAERQTETERDGRRLT